ncbi:hypothetical protein B0H10DRAFT_2429871 [Mycena sp. CBHHK59/15]|nr:hypothetical protein B0H10DRAFT_2429871 [Mycena sp. CBHHK59/15]
MLPKGSHLDFYPFHPIPDVIQSEYESATHHRVDPPEPWRPHTVGDKGSSSSSTDPYVLPSRPRPHIRIRIPTHLRGRARRRNQQSSPAASPSESSKPATTPRRAFVTLVVCCYALSDNRSYGAPSASCRACAPQAESAPPQPHLSLTHRHRLAPSQELAAAERAASLSAACARFRSRGDTHATWYGFYGFIPVRSRTYVRHPRTDCEDELVPYLYYLLLLSMLQ